MIGALFSVAKVSLLPPGIERRELEVAGASAHIAIDRPRPLVSDRLATDGDYQTLHRRSVLCGNIATSPPAVRHIARRASIDPALIAGVTRVTADVQATLTEPDSERRGNEIRESRLPYRLEVQPHPRLPTIDIYTQAPTVAEAARLADSVAGGLRDFERSVAVREGGWGPREEMRIVQMGPARAGVISGNAPLMIPALAFVFWLCVAAAAVALVSGRRRPCADAESASAMPARPAVAAEGVARRRTAPMVALTPAAALAGGGGTISLPDPRGSRERASSQVRADASAARLDDWPRTTRLLPWLIAALLAMVWLVPFNTVTLQASLPIDLNLDRLLLPLLVGVWLLALAAGGPGAPRIRMTPIHVGVLAVIGFACLSLVVNATDLNRTLEFETAVKKIVLLISYTSVFFVVASSVRRGEVPAFMSYMLALAVICALGTIWEYRSEYNVFYALTDQLLPSSFSVGVAEGGAVDDIGRRVVRGPAELPLETVAMITMGLPIAVVRLLGSSTWRGRLGYGLCAALMLAGALATYRKSALVAPASVFLTFAYFRRRELLRLAPLGVVLLVMIPVISPGAVGSVLYQLRGDRLNVATVSDRASDYDAVRPDVWSHLLLGRGYGSYEHTSYRILDMELLRQLIEVGALGLAAYILLLGSIVRIARGPIRDRSPDEAPAALVAAACAIAFLVVSMLFDVMSFPHTPYLVLVTAALLAVLVTTRGEPAERRAWS